MNAKYQFKGVFNEIQKQSIINYINSNKSLIQQEGEIALSGSVPDCLVSLTETGYIISNAFKIL